MARWSSVASLCSTMPVTAPVAAGLVADDPAVAGGVRDLGGQDGDGVGVGGVGRRERGERLAREQRGVAADDDHGAVDGPAELLHRHPHRVPRAVLLGLVGGAYGGVSRGEVRGDLLTGVADDDDEMPGVELTGGGDDMSDERAPGDLVQDLGGLRLHTGALTRCEDDDGRRVVDAHGYALRLRVMDTRRIPAVFSHETHAGPDRWPGPAHRSSPTRI